MVERVNKGLDPLESPILLLEDQILDGVHRSEIWMELAAEGVCEGFFVKNQPRFDHCKGSEILVAWLRVQSRNLVIRQLPADQRAAILMQLSLQFPEIKKAIDEIKTRNRERQINGTPLVAGDQRGNTNKEIAELAGVGATVMKEAVKLQKEAPEQSKNVAAGKTTAKKALKQIRDQSKSGSQSKTGKNGKKSSTAAAQNDAKAGSMSVGITVSSKVAMIREALSEHSIEFKDIKDDEGDVTLSFNGTGQQQGDVLIAIGQLLKAKGAMTVGLTLDK